MTLYRDSIFSYVLPGQVADPRSMFAQAAAAEEMGIAGLFLSERWETKELGATMGALAHATSSVRLVAGLTQFGTRHPVVQAGLAQTMQLLSGGRYVLGYGRGVPAHLRKLGIDVLSMQGMIDMVAILRQLWRGETVSYSGPAGDYPEMQLAQGCDNPPPIIIGTIGPKTLAVAGAHFDGVVLHPFLTVEGVAKSIATVRNAAADAGRDPSSVKIYATVVTAPDTLGEDQRLDIVEARAVSYFMHPEIGRQIARTNGWDEGPLAAIAETGLASLEYGSGDPHEKRRRMAEVASLLPRHWIEDGAAAGSIARCVERLGQYGDAGVDYVLLHGTTPDQQGDIVAAFPTR